MSEKVEKALEIVRSFSEAEFHSFMEMLYISESSHSSVSFNDLIGKTVSKTVSFVRIATLTLPSETANATVCRITNARLAANTFPTPLIPLL